MIMVSKPKLIIASNKPVIGVISNKPNSFYITTSPKTVYSTYTVVSSGVEYGAVEWGAFELGDVGGQTSIAKPTIYFNVEGPKVL